jgi:broad specificity phosphatase PhoE
MSKTKKYRRSRKIKKFSKKYKRRGGVDWSKISFFEPKLTPPPSPPSLPLLPLSSKQGVDIIPTRTNIELEPIDILVVSHQARIICLLQKFIINGTNVSKTIDPNRRFKNGAVILFELSPTDSTDSTFDFVIRLFYAGELTVGEKDYNKPNKLYWDTDDDTTNIEWTTSTKQRFSRDNRKFQNFPRITGKIDINQLSDNPGNIIIKKDKQYIIRVCRHGEADHNTGNKYIDTDLTEKGKYQATNTGTYFKNLNLIFNYYFVSDLYRTRRTLELILRSMNRFAQPNNTIVLPCSHEINESVGNMTLNYFREGVGYKTVRRTKCDGIVDIGNKVGATGITFGTPENVAKRLPDLIKTSTFVNNTQSFVTENELNFNVTWYLDYNRGNYLNSKCSNTNMFLQMLQIIDKEPAIYSNTESHTESHTDTGIYTGNLYSDNFEGGKKTRTRKQKNKNKNK